MIHFKSDGFTLVEAIIALVVMALILTPLYVLQTTTIIAVTHRSLLLDRLLYAKTMLINARRAMPKDARTFEQEKKSQKPVTNMKYSLKELPAESIVKKIPNLLLEQVTMQWKEEGKTYNETVSMIIFKPTSSPS